ncbi:L-seryl-tRNA(Sec) selenium transferase [Orbus sturtevantii]|uniref:L-seryl-tRNA(Sec) selenium transferase n=1 Tax=Orbus sturtevantii TaxID=3074109 RepID=UPI00370D483B
MQLSQIMQVEKWLSLTEIQPYHVKLSRPIVSEIIKWQIDQYREFIIRNNLSVDNIRLLSNIIIALENECLKCLQPVINATGIIVHTNLGRSPLPKMVWDNASDAMCRYSNLELNLHNGKRGDRMGILPTMLNRYFGGESALLVNNNAAAIHLILKAFAQGKEVIVSRGEQVQIGGGFRIPEILAESGAILRDVGTTNITTVDDYLDAITDNTSMVLIVHQSNYYIEGFSKQADIIQLAQKLPKHILLVVDQGSGNQLNGISGEKTVSHYLKAGAHLVCFSGDKILGGPQSGIILGQKSIINTLVKHPMMRVFRPGKETYILLEKLLIHYLNKDNDVMSRVQTVLNHPLEWHKERAEQIAIIAPNQLTLINEKYLIGGGTTPKAQFDTWAIEVKIAINPHLIIEQLRNNKPSIIATIKKDKVIIYPVTLFDDELERVKKVLQQILAN